MAEPISINVPKTDRNPAPFALTGEPVPGAPALAITPVWDMRTQGWSGHFAVSHIPTGCWIPRLAGCIVCIRRAAAVLAAMPVDWGHMTLDRDSNDHIAGEHLAGIERLALDTWSRCYGSLVLCEGAEVDDGS